MCSALYLYFGYRLSENAGIMTRSLGGFYFSMFFYPTSFRYMRKRVCVCVMLPTVKTAQRPRSQLSGPNSSFSGQKAIICLVGSTRRPGTILPICLESKHYSPGSVAGYGHQANVHTYTGRFIYLNIIYLYCNLLSSIRHIPGV
jgi:hypothetical protein